MNPIVMTKATPVGNAYAMLTPHGGAPAPTLLLFAMSASDTLSIGPYCRIGSLLYAQGWNVASLDMPCHGADLRSGEPAEIAGWVARIAAGEDIVAAFRTRVNDVVDHLVAEGIADPARIAAAGTSRGGFMAFHAAAGNPKIRAVAAFAPLTDLLMLTEFAGHRSNSLCRQLALANVADALAEREAWITIGDADERVGTDKAVAFAGLLKGPVALRVLPVPGHSSLPEWHDDATKWLTDRIPYP